MASKEDDQRRQKQLDLLTQVAKDLRKSSSEIRANIRAEFNGIQKRLDHSIETLERESTFNGPLQRLDRSIATLERKSTFDGPLLPHTHVFDQHQN